MVEPFVKTFFDLKMGLRGQIFCLSHLDLRHVCAVGIFLGAFMGYPFPQQAMAEDAPVSPEILENAKILESIHSESSPLEDFKQKILGRYAHFDAVAYEQKLLFMDMKTYVITYGITDFYRSESGEIMSRSRYCHATHLSNMPFKSEVPDSFTRAIIPRDSVVQFIPKGNNTWGVFRPETPTPIGIRLEDPSEALPQDPADPRISDDDHDGKPGVTVKLKLYGSIDTEIYIARREIFAYHLEQRPNGELEGFVRDRSEQLVVGSPLPFLRQSASPTQHPDPLLSPIVLVPIADDDDCDKVMARGDLLFPPEPSIW
jgi:hypothetical protein